MLSSFLLSRPGHGAPGKIDDSLNAIFAASAKPTTVTNPPVDKRTSSNILESPSPVQNKKKRKQEKSEDPNHSSKRHKKDEDLTKGLEKLQIQRNDSGSKRSKSSKGSQTLKEDHGEGSSSQKTGTDRRDDEQHSAKSAHGKKHRFETPDSSDKPAEETTVAEEVDEDSEGDQELVHETISGKTLRQTKGRKTVHYVPEGETSEQRDERTVFVGNLPMAVLIQKPMQKALKRHLLSCMPSSPEPTSKIESIRYRSVAFKAPTNPLALKDNESKGEGVSHKKERAAAWKNTQKEETMETDGVKPKSYLTPAEKKRIAFIKGEFHEQGDSVNAFVVFAHQDPDKATSQTLIVPADAAALVVEKLNRSKFEGRTLRVDRVGQASKSVNKDTSKTIFVGNLDFAAKEEELRTFFETLLTTEMGPARSNADENEESSSSEDDDDSLPAGESQWVHDVRIIRDEDTQLGKGFAYVRFSERSCVDEILAMEQGRLKFAKRKLRVTRYNNKGSSEGSKSNPKQTPKGSTKPSTSKPSTSKSSTSKGGKETSVKHRGDPALGERLKGLSKEERKDAKKNDANRLARRLEKKKARLELDKSLNNPKKDRIRVRKAKAISGAKGSKRKPTKRPQT